jgi:hypothetical protein
MLPVWTTIGRHNTPKTEQHNGSHVDKPPALQNWQHEQNAIRLCPPVTHHTLLMCLLANCTEMSHTPGWMITHTRSAGATQAMLPGWTAGGPHNTSKN